MWHAEAMSSNDPPPAPPAARHTALRSLMGKRAALGVFLIALSSCIMITLWQREKYLDRQREAAAREATQRASIDAFEVQVRALVDRQRQELDALKANAHSWDEATRERVQQLEVKFQEAARDAELLIAEQRRQLGAPAAPAPPGAKAQ
jgi:hypothetical protein